LLFWLLLHIYFVASPSSSFPFSFVVPSLYRKRLADNVNPRAGEGGKRDKEKQKEKERREQEKDAILREKKVRA
jgi:hypothetical protein